MRLNTLLTSVIARSPFGRELQSVGAATTKALSPVFDRTAGVESEIPVLAEDLRL